MRDIRASSKVTTKTARKAKAACVWCVEMQIAGEWCPHSCHTVDISADRTLRLYERDVPESKFRIRKYTRAD